jgi:fibronectin type 3 domain-containing protein
MKISSFPAVVLMLLLVFIAGCGGSGSGESSVVEGGTETISDNVTGGSLTLAWDNSLSSDGTPVANIAGYSVYYGTSPGVYDTKIDNGTSTTCTITGLRSGTYYIAVTCYDVAGTESAFSNEVSKTFQ